MGMYDIQGPISDGDSNYQIGGTAPQKSGVGKIVGGVMQTPAVKGFLGYMSGGAYGAAAGVMSAKGSAAGKAINMYNSVDNLSSGSSGNGGDPSSGSTNDIQDASGTPGGSKLASLDGESNGYSLSNGYGLSTMQRRYNGGIS